MRIWLRVGTFVVVAGTLVALTVSIGKEKASTPVGGGVRLVAYTGCADMLSQLRQHAAAHADRLGPQVVAAGGGVAVPERAAVPAATSAAPAAPQHSTTTVHEPGVDEPDLVKTDGRRVVTVSQGVLYVADTATRRITGSVQLSANANAWSPADLLMSGDRALVINPGFAGEGMGPVPPVPSWPASQLVLVDLTTPRVLGTMTISGSYVDARMVGSMVRVVARSQPRIEPLPVPSGAMRSAVRRAPLSAWLPSYQITEGGTAYERTVDCSAVSHPRDYTGTSMLTIYSVDLPGHLGDIQPISLAADGDTVYATTSSLYVASNPYWFYAVPIAVPESAGGAPNSGEPLLPHLPPQQTEIHRFDITGFGPPRYVASGSVPGRLLNQYALSDYDGYLRVATTSGEAVPESAVYELAAGTLTRVGSVGGLGRGQRIYAVRFIGPIGYVVTFRQVDPLYTLDLRDPARPRVAGELELTGYSSYLAPAADGELIGVGQEATNQGHAVGLQVALFDVHDPAHPRRLAQLVKNDFHSAAEFDPHAFLYWPTTGTAVLPVNSWTNGSSTQSALVLTVGASDVAVAGTISQPGAGDQVGVSRAMVIGDELWTLSDAGLMVSDLGSLTTSGWIPF